MSPEKIAFFVVISIFSLLFIAFLIIKGPKRIKQEHFRRKWRTLQARCSDKSQWGTAVVEADNLLAEALKKKRIKGSSTGERLVEVQRTLTDNDAVWFGHKLRAKIDADPDIKLNQADVKRALMGIGQALKDIGALK
jgi:hypothetical protein